MSDQYLELKARFIRAMSDFAYHPTVENYRRMIDLEKQVLGPELDQQKS